MLEQYPPLNVSAGDCGEDDCYAQKKRKSDRYPQKKTGLATRVRANSRFWPKPSRGFSGSSYDCRQRQKSSGPALGEIFPHQVGLMLPEKVEILKL